jgi:hypothetical protein
MRLLINKSSDFHFDKSLGCFCNDSVVFVAVDAVEGGDNGTEFSKPTAVFFRSETICEYAPFNS